MIKSLLFATTLWDKDEVTSAFLADLSDSYEIEERSRLAPTIVDLEWVVRCGPARNIYIHDVIGIPEYNLCGAIHVGISEEDLMSKDKLQSQALDYLNIIISIIEHFTIHYGVCDVDERIKLRNIPGIEHLNSGQHRQPS